MIIYFLTRRKKISICQKILTLKIIDCPNPPDFVGINSGSNDFQRFTPGIYPETSGGRGN
jgi:hypothetical protein